MHGGLLKKKLKSIVLFIHFRNVNGTSSDIAAPRLSHLYRKSLITFSSTLSRSDPLFSGFLSLFRLNPTLSDYEKMDEEPVGEFLW